MKKWGIITFASNYGLQIQQVDRSNNSVHDQTLSKTHLCGLRNLSNFVSVNRRHLSAMMQFDRYYSCKTALHDYAAQYFSK